VKSKQTEEVVLKTVLQDKNFRLQPKDTCIYANEGIMTIRFALDKTYYGDPFEKFD
jgi:hypothetical protein